MERYVKYGDYLLLHSAEDRVKFMMGRAWQEGDVYLVESSCPGIAEDIGNYPHTSGLIFALYPQ